MPTILDKGGYFDLTTLDAGSDLRRDTVNALKAVGIPVEYTHHEVGPSQHEIDMRYAEGLRMSDNAMTYRIVVKEIAHQHGVYATFMPKPLFGENGSGMHTHQSLFSDGSNAFFDADDRYHLSAAAKAYIAGLLRHAREIAALFAPNVNSYKRLVPGYEAPVYCAWSQRNRSALVRVPVYHPGKEQATRCELRCPDPSCNPYLTFAAMLHAGLDGIEQGYECPEPMETQPLRPHATTSASRARHRAAPRDARRGDRGAGRVGAGAQGARRPHLRALRGRSSARSGRSTGSRSPGGSWSATCPSSEPAAGGPERGADARPPRQDARRASRRRGLARRRRAGGGRGRRAGGDRAAGPRPRRRILARRGLEELSTFAGERLRGEAPAGPGAGRAGA